MAEWVHLTAEQLAADPTLGEAIHRFQSVDVPAGRAAEEFLKGHALSQTETIATYVLLDGGEIAAFYSLGMGSLELRTSHQGHVGVEHPRPGAVLILWLARAAGSQVSVDEILTHAVGMGQYGARHVGAAVIALDPYDASTEVFWRERFGFRTSRTRLPDANGEQRARLWNPLFP